MKREPTVISTFAGCGGSSLGYTWAGYKELLAIEWEQNAVDTFKLNFKDVPVWQRDIKIVTSDEILEFLNINVGDLDLLDGSPPCQGFSTAGKREVNDDRNDLFKDYVRLIEGLQPKVFVMENVSGMIKGKMRGRFIEIMNTLKSLDYNVKCKLMNAMYYNVPQSRQRLIFMGIRKDLNIEPSFPAPSKKVITFRDATKNINDYCDRELPDVLKKVGKLQPINSWSTNKNIYKRVKGNLSSSFSTKWANHNDVIGTIIKSEISLTGIVHPNRQRYLNLDELKVCSSFPIDFKFTDRKNGYERIGNAVMPKFMQAIAENIKETVFDKIQD